jgi:hypothetical protein
MTDEAKETEVLEQPGEPVMPMASARALDLEYGDLADPRDGDAPRQVFGHCPGCQRKIVVQYSVSLDAWEQLIDLICQVTEVSARRLLEKGKRPTDAAFQARCLLVHALAKVAGDDDCVRWLDFVGFERRWTREVLQSALAPSTEALLDQMNLALQIGMRSQP